MIMIIIITIIIVIILIIITIIIIIIIIIIIMGIIDARQTDDEKKFTCKANKVSAFRKMTPSIFIATILLILQLSTVLLKELLAQVETFLTQWHLQPKVLAGTQVG